MTRRKLEEWRNDPKFRKLCEVLNSLADKHPHAEAPEKIPYRATIEGIARQLMLTAYPATPPVLTSAARDKFSKLRSVASELFEDYQFNLAVPELRWPLALVASLDAEELDSRMAKGRPPKANAESVAFFFKAEFFRLTGKEPTSYRDGGYCAHLQMIFDALGIEAKASSFLGATRPSSRKNTPKNTAGIDAQS